MAHTVFAGVSPQHASVVGKGCAPWPLVQSRAPLAGRALAPRGARRIGSSLVPELHGGRRRKRTGRKLPRAGQTRAWPASGPPATPFAPTAGLVGSLCKKRKGASRYRGTARRPILAFFCVGEKSRKHPIHADGARQCPNGAQARLERRTKKTKFICRNGTASWEPLPRPVRVSWASRRGNAAALTNPASAPLIVAQRPWRGRPRPLVGGWRAPRHWPRLANSQYLAAKMGSPSPRAQERLRSNFSSSSPGCARCPVWQAS